MAKQPSWRSNKKVSWYNTPAVAKRNRLCWRSRLENGNLDGPNLSYGNLSYLELPLSQCPLLMRSLSYDSTIAIEYVLLQLSGLRQQSPGV